MSALLIGLSLGSPAGAGVTLAAQRLLRWRRARASSDPVSHAEEGEKAAAKAAMRAMADALLGQRLAARQQQLAEHRRELAGDDPALDALLQRLEASYAQRAASTRRGGGW